MEGTIGEMRMFAGNFPPKNWAFSQGQIIAIASNTALFSILGTMYGGNGTTTFALPNLAGRIPIGAGQGPGLTNVEIGEIGGSPAQTLAINQLPAHIHILVPASPTVAPGDGTGKISLGTDPTGNFPGQTGPGIAMYTATNNAQMASVPLSVQVGISGSNLPFGIMQPGLGMNYIICMRGVFPARN